MGVEDMNMSREQREALEAQGWRFGSAADFLGLSPAEAAYVEAHLRLSRALRDRRREQGWTQMELAQRLGSSQSRVAKAEAGEASVALDFLARALFGLGASVEEVGAALAGRTVRRRSAGKAARRPPRAGG
jgi:DNA-binding XRE family transcriptional regulator